jgi:hypothetical protein
MMTQLAAMLVHVAKYVFVQSASTSLIKIENPLLFLTFALDVNLNG